MSTVLPLVKPFMTKKMQDRLLLKVPEELPGIIGDSHMPSYLGGPVDSSPEATIAKLRAGYRPWITQEQQEALEAEVRRSSSG